MNRNTSIALLGAVFAVTAGMLSVNAFSATPFLVAQSASTAHDDALIQGHVTYLVKDSDGEIKRYIQSDNLVVNVGETCVAQAMFRSNGTNCDVFADQSGNPSTTNGFNWIAIGNGTTLVTAADTALPGGGTNGGEKQRLQSIAAITNSTGTGATAVMSKTFSFDEGTLRMGTVRNSGLFDKASSGGHLFSAQDISVPVGASDTLTVTWTITLGS